MKLIRKLQQKTPDCLEYAFWCPACKCSHGFKTTGGEPRWTFNSDFDKPTIRASILVKHSRAITNEEHKRLMGGEELDIPRITCHLFITDGKIEYCTDCTHDLAGKTVDMVPF